VMEVRLAKTAGFCFGVKRAMEQVYQEIEEGEHLPIYTFGPIIHNEEVVKELERKGVKAIETEEELFALTSGTVIIRSHGVPREVCGRIEKQGLTCGGGCRTAHLPYWLPPSGGRSLRSPRPRPPSAGH